MIFGLLLFNFECVIFVDCFGGVDLFFDFVYVEIFSIICEKVCNGDLVDLVMVLLVMVEYFGLVEFGGGCYFVCMVGVLLGFEVIK